MTEPTKLARAMQAVDSERPVVQFAPVPHRVKEIRAFVNAAAQQLAFMSMNITIGTWTPEIIQLADEILQATNRFQSAHKSRTDAETYLAPGDWEKRQSTTSPSVAAPEKTSDDDKSGDDS